MIERAANCTTVSVWLLAAELPRHVVLCSTGVMPPRLIGVRFLLRIIVLATAFITFNSLYNAIFDFHGLVKENAYLNEIVRPYLPNVSNVSIMQDYWQEVPGAKDKLFVYSAFVERRGAFKLRVVGASSRLVEETVWCHFWYGEVPSASVKATLKMIDENHMTNFSACFIFCPLHYTFPVPDSVSIVTEPSSMPANRLPVIDNNPEDLAEPMKLAVCVKPLDNYNNTLELIEFLELYAILGVDNVAIYTRAVSRDVRCALDVYSGGGDVTELSFHLDDVSNGTDGGVAAVNDCLYRYINRYSNMIVVDLDNFILPRSFDKLVHLLEYLDKENDAKKTVGSYEFKNSFFYLNWPQYSSTVDPNDPWLASLYTTSKLRRKMQLENYGLRSSYVFKPDRVVEVGNYRVVEHMPGFAALQVAPNVALGHHYTACDVADCSRLGSKVDKSALRYQDWLLRKVKEKWDLMRKRCDFPDIAKVARDREV